MTENRKVALGIFTYMLIVFTLTIAQVNGMLFDASSVYEQAPNLIMWIVVVGSWIALFLILWVFFTRTLNQRS